MQGKAYSLEVRSQAVALALELGSFSRAVEALATVLPAGSDVPDDSIILRWTKRLEPSAYNVMQTERRAAIQDQWLDLEEMSLDRLKQGVRSGQLKGQLLENMAGISADKRQRAEEMERRTGSGGGIRELLALVQRKEHELLPDGSTRTTETKAIIAAEGDME